MTLKHFSGRDGLDFVMFHPHPTLRACDVDESPFDNRMLHVSLEAGVADSSRMATSLRDFAFRDFCQKEPLVANCANSV